MLSMLITNSRNAYVYDTEQEAIQELKVTLVIKSIQAIVDKITIKGELRANAKLENYKVFFVINGKRYKTVIKKDNNIELTMKIEENPVVLSAMLNIDYANIYIPFKCKGKNPGEISREMQGTVYTIKQLTKKKLELATLVKRDKTPKEKLKNFLINSGVLR